MPSYRQGQIIWAIISDPWGNTKPDPRPAIVLADMPVNATEIPVVACTTQVHLPLKPDQVRLPSHPTGNVCTKLTRDTIAVCSWTAAVKVGDEQFYNGYVKATQMQTIMEKYLLFGQ